MRSLKTCTHCKTERPLSDFYSKGVRLDAKCKLCVKENKKNKRKSRNKKKQFDKKNRASSKTINISDYEIIETGELSDLGAELVVDFLLRKTI